MQAAVEPARIVAGRYRVERLLKRGLGVETVLARDVERDADVVLKTAPASALSGGARERLEHEAEVLRAVRSPHLTPLLELGREGDVVFLVVPFVPGTPLDARLRDGPLAPPDALAVGRCLLAALNDAHAHGVLHRDVKPANVIVDGRTPIAHATLVDFGFARSARLDASIRELPVGTVRYVSPEQAGLIAGGVDERSDLYSAGATLYECLAGRPAFDGESAGEVLRHHLGPRPPDTRALGLGTPRALDEVVQRLLRVDPRERYQSAEAALADLDEIGRALARGVADPEVAIGARDRRATLAEPAFIGRADELEALDAELARAVEGRGRLVLLEAPSGGGKTRLLDEVARRAARQGAWVLRGQGVEKAAPRPFQLLDGVVREVVSAARTEGGLAGRIASRLGPAHLEAAGGALPELGAALGAPAAVPLGAEAHGEVRALRALAALLDALGASGRPALVLLDDGQWADELTLRLLRERQRAARDSPARERHVLVVLSFRSEEVPAGHALRGLDADRRIAVRPLDPDETRRLAESMAGELPGDAVDAIVRAAEGSPFLAAAVLHGMVEAGALVASPGGWRVERDRLAEAGLSRRAAVLLARRLEQLPADALRLLAVGALLGKEFDLDLATALAGATVRAAAAAVAEARRRQILWTDGSRARAVFAHDKLREALLARLKDDERRRLHRLAAERIEIAERRDGSSFLARRSAQGVRGAEPPEDDDWRERVFDLAYHFDGAGDGARALPYALAAAERARARHAIEVAERYYRIAERYATAAGEATRLRVLEGLADVLLLRGRYEEGARRYEEARALCPDRGSASQVEGKLGQLEMKRGRNRVAIGALERALKHLGRPAPRTRLGLALHLLRGAAVQALHTFLPRLLVGRRALADAAEDLTAARFLKHLSLAYFLDGDALRSLWAHLLMMNLAERYPPTAELGQAYGEHGWVLAAFGRGRRYAARGTAICEAVGDLWGRARTLLCLTYARCTAGRHAEAVEAGLEGERLFERVGDPWEGNWERAFRMMAHFQAGEAATALELCRRGYASSCEIGDGFGAAEYVHFMTRIDPRSVPRAWIEAESARPRDHIFEVETLLQAKAEIALAEGRAPEAVAAFEEAYRIVRQAGVWFDTVVPIPSRLAAALREEAAAVAPVDARRREALLARARRMARRGVRAARLFRNNRPLALRELGLVEAALGRPRRARRLLDEALAVAERQGQRLERARVLLARAEVGRALGWPRAAEDEAEGRGARRECGLGAAGAAPADGSPAPTVTLSLADRFGTVLEAGRKIATARTREAVFAAAREAALSLLRGERCAVVGLPADHLSSAEASGGASRTAIERAVAARRPVVIAEGLAGDAPDSVVLSGVRSALCAPVLVHGQPAAALYVTHAQVGGLFGEDEARLAEFVATLAGAALENAEGFAANRRAEDDIRTLSEALAQGQEDERRHLSLALHDGAGQILAALGLRVDDLADAGADADGDGRRARRGEAIASLRSLVDQLGAELRGLAHDLRPAALDRLGLREALVDLAESSTSGTLAVETRFDRPETPPEAPPPTEVAVAVFRIAQAALANVVRHAAARRASVALERLPGALRLTIEDDGAGFDPAALPPGRGIGIIGMRERAAWVGGTFELDAAPGRGTRVRVEVPVARRERGTGP